MIVMYHRGGPPPDPELPGYKGPCGQPALGLHRRMARKGPDQYDIPANNVVLLDGTRPQRGDNMLCGFCRQPIIPQWLFESPDPQPITV